MGDPRAQLMTFPLALGMDNVSHPEEVQPVGARPRHVLSRNTRLSKLVGCVSKAPGVTTLASVTGPVGGVVPIGNGDSSLVPALVPSATRRVAESVAAPLPSLNSATAPQSAYYPAQVSAAGILRGSDNVRWNASCAYLESFGWTFYVTLRAQGSALFADAGVYLNVVDDSGAEIVPSTLLVQFTTDVLSDENFVAVTVHGSNVVLWYAAAGAASLAARTVSVDPSTYAVTLGTVASIYTPAALTTGPKRIQVAYDPIDSTNAYVAIQHTVAANTAVLRVAVPGLTVAASTFVASGTHEWVGIAYKSGEGVLLATVAAGSPCNFYELNSSSLSTVWSALGILDTGAPSLGFQTHNGVVYRVIALSRFEAAQTGTYVAWYTPAGAAFGTTTVLKHQTMIGHVVTLRGSNDVFNALFTTQTCYDPLTPENSYNPNSNGFLPDPSVDVFRSATAVDAAGSTVLTAYCVARLGADSVIRYPGGLNLGSTLFIGSSCSCVNKSGNALITYLQENTIDGNIADGYSVRFAELSFDSLQPRMATSQDGVTVIAGALPAVWDGALLTELSPLRQPKITGAATGGGGLAMPAGAYMFAVVVSWKDAAGTSHRSAPSNVLTLSNGVNPLDPLITVYLSNSYRDLLTQPGYQVVVYASEVDDTTPYATRMWQVVTGISYATETANLNSPFAGTAGAFTPAIYTDGSETQELAAYCPNACLDAEVVADRLWLLDAERQGVWPYSKPKAPGVFFEMSPDQSVVTPSSAGRGVAVSQWNGNPLFLTERGVWTCSGEGPDALLNPPMFSAAVQVSDVACSQRNSVVRSPAGVMYVSNARFVRFNGQMAEYPEINAVLYGNVVGTAVFRKQQEVVWFTFQGYAYVYNWVADAFTVWDQAVTGMSSITGCAQRADGKVLLANATLLRLMDPETVSADAQISITTGHVQLGDKQDNNNLENFVLHAKRGGPHALGLVLGCDYVSPTNTKSRDATQILNSTNSAGVYDLMGEPTEQAARAVQFAIAEGGASGEGFQPISMTLEVIKKPGKAVRNLPDSARM